MRGEAYSLCEQPGGGRDVRPTVASIGGREPGNIEGSSRRMEETGTRMSEEELALLAHHLRVRCGVEEEV